MEDGYSKITTVLSSNGRITIPEPALKASKAEQGDILEVLFKVVSKKE